MPNPVELSRHLHAPENLNSVEVNNTVGRKNMKAAHTLLFMASGIALASLSGADQPAQPPSAAELVQRYSFEYTTSPTCDEVDAPHIDYREEFYQRLRATADQELKRLLALTGLCSEIESEIRRLADRTIRTGKSTTRKMKKEERIQCEAHIRELLSDLAILDPADSKKAIAGLTARLETALKGRK